MQESSYPRGKEQFVHKAGQEYQNGEPVDLSLRRLQRGDQHPTEKYGFKAEEGCCGADFQ